ncbi:MAG: translocation/assembly module TamB, partial [Muribaculaceae bacterium]|nr:translocation/assembly module TamB [Muribaculaceae bacterium]
RNTSLDADIHVNSITYNKHPLTDIDLRARVDSGMGDIALVSSNRDAAFDIRAKGNLSSAPYSWTMQADLADINLQGLGFTDSVMKGSANIHGRATITPGPRGAISANIDLRDLDWTMSSSRIHTDGLRAHFLTNDSVTSAMINDHDLTAHFESPMSLDTIMARLTTLSSSIDSVMAKHYIDVHAIQQTMPPFTLDMTAGSNNIINNYLTSADMGITGLDMLLRNDSLINMRARVLNFNSGSTAIDTITANIYQNTDTLKYLFTVGNRPGTLDQWAHVTAYGRLAGNHASFLINQENIDNLTGYRLGLIAQWLPDEIIVKVVPKNPIIGYKTWTVNDSNFVSLNTVKNHFDADLNMRSDESSIHLYTDETAHKADSLQEDLILDIKDIKLQEWLVLNPFAPPITGNVSADMRFGWDNKAINGSGLLSLADFTYGKERVGSFDLGVDLSTNSSGTVRASASLMVDSIKTITAVGNLNDSTARNPFLLDFRMIHFPLHILNPFLPKDMASLNGSLNGVMDITGSLAEPIFNGHLTFDSTSLTIPMFGTTYHFSDNPIPMDSNVVTFDNYRIESANDNPLVIGGTVDARHISDIRIDLEMAGNEMQLINSKKKRGVMVFGKAFANLNATVRGNMERLNVNATVDILENTNVTYVLSSATDNLTSRSNIDMVKFVNFSDTTLVAKEDSITTSSMMMAIDATLRVYQGSVLTVDLSTDGKNRVQLLTSGNVNYNMNYMGDSRVTGRLNLNGGYVRYTPPLMSEKIFNFQEGSYVSFNGDMMNPYLNIKAIDVLRANVQQDGQNSRLIDFDVILSITNNLDNMDLAFDLTTNDDITVANELQSMTPEQRANQAMNLLLYNVYTGPGTKASSSLNGNPLYSFLESQVNSWAANNIKGVDLSFGIDQYDRTVDGASQTTTSYSYKVSKSLFNDRFKISVGGNYSTDTDANENLAQNLINDISFEYYLTPTGSMYIKIFRHTGYESILEGEVTQTGVGFVYKRKLRKLKELFTPLYHRVKSIPVLSHGKENKEKTPDEPDKTDSSEVSVGIPQTKDED